MDIRITAEMTRDVPREWEQSLREISPITDAFSHLYFKWEFVLGKVKGRWTDRSRWVLYQKQPAWAIPAGLRRMLEDKPPRLMAEGPAWARRQFVDDYAHEMYRTERVFVRPVWVIQGPNGGVPAGYSEAEVAVLKAIGQSTDPPPVGFLPYAHYDWRVREQLLIRDRLLQAGMEVDRLVQAPILLADYRREVERAQQAYRNTFLNWFKGTLAPSADFLTWFSRRSEADRLFRKASKRMANASARLVDEYIETGEVA